MSHEIGGVDNFESVETPVFLVGCVRSGSTLLTLMLSHHPEIAFPGEFELCVDQIGQDGALPNMADYHEWLRSHRHFRGHNLEIDPELDYPQLVRSFLTMMKLEKGGGPKAHVGAAIHWNFEHLPRLWPHARFIHLLRDPRDVCASIMVQGWAGNHYMGALQWRETEESWDKLRSRIPRDRWLEIRFEDLARETESTLTRICAFIGVPYSARMLSYPEDTTYSQVDPDVGQRWRTNQTPREIQLGEAAAGGLLETRGYQTSGHASLIVGPAYHRWLEFHSRLVTLRFRLARYGLRLWLERRLALALGLKSWRERIRLREHEIKNRHLK